LPRSERGESRDRLRPGGGGAGLKLSGWLRTSLVVAAVAAGALLLWVGLALLVVALVIVAIPFAIWSGVRRRRAPGGADIVAGSATGVDEKIVLGQLPSDAKTRSGAPRDS